MTTTDTRLEGKVAIVTGASGSGSGDLWGNGEAIAIMFARQGAKVLLVSRDRKNAENANVVHQDIQLPIRLYCGPHHPFAGVIIGNVTSEERGLAPLLV